MSIYNLPESVILNRKNLKIKTPNGYEEFLGVNKIIKNSYYRLKFSNGERLDCSEDHPILTIEGIIKAKDLTKKVSIQTEDKLGCFVISKQHIKKKIELFDIVNSGKDHLYYTNGIVSHNCEFLGSSNTLIDGAKLLQLYAKDYIDEVYGMEIYEHPIKETIDNETQNLKNKDHIYVICADISEGKNLDYTAFSVFDCSTIPYKQVATYRSNTISPLLIPDILKQCAEYYNNAYVLVEINNSPQVANCLFQDLEYENVFRIYSGNKLAQQLSESGKATQNGLNMSPLVKRTGCSTLKTLIETNKLEIYSADTIYELSTFIVNRGSFAAEDGANDDLAMTLVQFAWLTTQKLFIEISSSDIRKQLSIENNFTKNEVAADAPPEPMFANDISENYIVEDGDAWMLVDMDEFSYF